MEYHVNGLLLAHVHLDFLPPREKIVLREGIPVGNLLPARVKVVCVDINPATVTKLADRGTFQTIGLVTDVEPFLRVLVSELGIG